MRLEKERQKEQKKERKKERQISLYSEDELLYNEVMQRMLFDLEIPMRMNGNFKNKRK